MEALGKVTIQTLYELSLGFVFCAFILIKKRVYIRVSNASASANRVKAGMDLALLANWLVNQAIEIGELVKLLPAWKAIGSGDINVDQALWIVTPLASLYRQKNKCVFRVLREEVTKRI